MLPSSRRQLTAMRKISCLEGVEAVLKAETGDLRKLAEIACIDPRILYVGTDMKGVDIRGQDLRGMIFSRLRLNEVIWDDQTQLDGGDTKEDLAAVLIPEHIAGLHDRSRERSQLKRQLEAGSSIVMIGPRRVGKSWIIGRLAADLRADGWHVIEIDVQGVRALEEFARTLCLRIEAQTVIRDRFGTLAVHRLNSLLGGSWGEKPLDAIGKMDPIEFTETLIASLDEAGEKTAIIIDEMSYFFLALAEESVKEADAFAYKLRAIQQRYKNIRWLITGSVGLNIIARRYDMANAFVDFQMFALESFTSAEALSYVRDLATQQMFNHNFDASDADFEAMFAKLGWLVPYYLNLIANEVRPSINGAADGPATATRADLDAAFEKLLEPNRKSAFAIWREYIDKNLPRPERTIAKHILDFLSRRGPDGETEHALLDHVSSIEPVTRPQLIEILAMLENDRLIAKIDQRYTFLSGLVRRYWQEYEAEWSRGSPDMFSASSKRA